MRRALPPSDQDTEVYAWWAYVVILATLLALLSANPMQGQTLRDALQPYHGMVEQGRNRGPFIDTCNRWARVPLGSPYCASCGGYIVAHRLALATPPRVPARARAWITANAVDAKDVWLGKATVPVPCLVIWVRKGGGHLGILVSAVDGLRCFEFNTSPDRSGSQWDGKWSGWKRRTVRKHCSPLNAYRITHFVPLPKEGLRGGGFGIRNYTTTP